MNARERYCNEPEFNRLTQTLASLICSGMCTAEDIHSSLKLANLIAMAKRCAFSDSAELVESVFKKKSRDADSLKRCSKLVNRP